MARRANGEGTIRSKPDRAPGECCKCVPRLLAAWMVARQEVLVDEHRPMPQRGQPACAPGGIQTQHSSEVLAAPLPK
jgi:hypothetical protein